MSMPPSKRSSPWFFFTLAYGVSWFFWIPAALSGQDVMTFPFVLLLYLGGIGPPLVGIMLTYLIQDREGWHDYWLRVIQFKRIGIGWYAVILLAVPILGCPRRPAGCPFWRRGGTIRSRRALCLPTFGNPAFCNLHFNFWSAS